MDVILNIINNLNLSESTKVNYLFHFKTIHDNLSIGDSLDYITDLGLLLYYLESLDNVNDKKIKATVISNILQINKNRYSIQINGLKNYIKLLI